MVKMDLSGKGYDGFPTKLKFYFEMKDKIVMAFLFGSWAKGLNRPDSDVDIVVYFRPRR